MKMSFLIVEGRPPDWVGTARAEYVAKLSPFVKFEVRSLKSPIGDRDSADVKRKREGEKILAELDAKDMLILFDEGGKLADSSEAFAAQLGRVLESGKSRVVLVIGGPYGFSGDVRERAQAKWSLSKMTMNHWVAQLAALEQIYRGFTILKGIPYHNR